MDNKKSIDSLNIETRIAELKDIKKLHEEFGDPAFVAIRKYYQNSGYMKGYERLSRLVSNEKIHKKDILNNPVKSVENFLSGYFKDRGGNMPEIWSEKNTVYLKTPYYHL